MFFPTFAMAPLGLVHLHLFVAESERDWSRFPYAVEQVWLTRNFCDRVRYLHCVVPRVHRRRLETLLVRLVCGGEPLEWVWTGDGEQHFNTGLAPPATREGPRLVSIRDPMTLLADVPFVVPVIFEAWHTRVRLASVWHRVAGRLQHHLLMYFPRQRLSVTRGPRYVRHAYAALQEAGLFRQYWIRYRPLRHGAQEVLLVGPASAQREALAQRARAVESWHGEGQSVLRMVGSHDLLDALPELVSSVTPNRCTAYVALKHPPVGRRPRFAYERFFDPVRAAWRYSDAYVRSTLGVRP